MIHTDPDGRKRYEALVIGGTWAGDVLRSDSNHLILGPWVPVPEFEPVGKVPQTETFETEVYRFVSGLRGPFEIDFWVPVSVPSSEALRWALNELCRSYRDRSQDKANQLLRGESL